MIVRRLVLLAVCGCGRLQFEPRPDADSDTSGPPDAVICPASYTATGGSCYRFIELPWATVEQMCEADGAHLIVIDDAAEIATVAPIHSAVQFWIGVSDAVVEGDFLRVTGGAAFLSWQAGEPNGGIAENCVLLHETLGMSDNACTLVDDALCEFDGQLADPSAF